MEKLYHPSMIGGLEIVYGQATGAIAIRGDEDVPTVIARGYSGASGHVNRPESEALKSRGPIPRGLWMLDAPVRDHPKLGPCVIPLEAAEGTETFGRSLFRIHGDNARGDFTASEGCIVASRQTREVIAALYWAGVRVLYVE